MSDSDTEAVRQHSREAESFTAGYDQLGQDPYASCFAYSRRRLDLLLARLLPAQPATAGPARRRLRYRAPPEGAARARVRRASVSTAPGPCSREARGLDRAVPLAQSDVTALPFRVGVVRRGALGRGATATCPTRCRSCARSRACCGPGGDLPRDRRALAEPQRLPDREPTAARAAAASRRCASTSRASRALRAQLVAAGLVPVERARGVLGSAQLGGAPRAPAPARRSCGAGRRPTRASSAGGWGRSTANMLLAVARRPEASA